MRWAAIAVLMVGVIALVLLLIGERPRQFGAASQTPERRPPDGAAAAEQLEMAPPRLQERRDFGFDDETDEVDQEQGGGVQPVPWEQVHGQIFDASTGEPVPQFLLRIRGPLARVSEAASRGDEAAEEPRPRSEFDARALRTEDVVTDADGRFTSSGGFEVGLLDFVLADHQSYLQRRDGWHAEPARMEHAHAFDDVRPSEEVHLRIPVGPTYRLDLRMPPGEQLESFFATFPQPSQGSRELHRALAGNAGSPMALFYGSVSNPEGLEQRAPIREGEPLWVRFPHPIALMAKHLGAGAAHELHVRSRDGLWLGQAPVASVEGIHPELVPITLERCGAIEGTVRDGDGRPLPAAWIKLFAPSAPLKPSGELGADAMGGFRLLWLPAGTYGLVVETDLHEPWRSEVHVAQGSIARVEVRLGQAKAHGTISGILRSRTGRHRSKGGILMLVSQDDPSSGLLRTAAYRKRDGEYVAPFLFEDVPSGEYELTLRPFDNLRWDKLRMIVSPPAEGLEFLCEDDAPTFDLEFRAIDADSGAAIERSWSIVWQGDPADDVRLDDDWETKRYQGVPEGVALRWVLRAQGYRLATGDESDVLGTLEHRFVEARLRPGCGQLFKVTTRDRVPLEGVELVADGRPIGKTDVRGLVAMDLDAKPGILEFRYKDWTVTWGRVDPSEEGFGWGPETPVYMAPAR